MARYSRKHIPFPVGTRFGKLTTVEPTTGALHWVKCKCDCGNEKTIRLDHLVHTKRRSTVPSCGCAAFVRLLKHGHNRRSEKTISEYGIWSSMRTRCTNPSAGSFKYYGGRGITICKRWDDFATFLKDMGPRPSPKHTIDRRDNDGNYEPDNCRWATRQQQAENKRRVVRLTFEGRTQMLSEWATETGIPRRVLGWRFHAGWTVVDIITTPWRPRPDIVLAWERIRARRAA